jgi:deazaflavin-dependent oxidoreductase (nitroreductase family)
MSIQQAIRDRVRVLNKHATNRILIHIAGRSFGHFSILTHTGRKTGRIYRIPVIAEPVENGFVFALTYGRKVDWGANVLARGGCSLKWKNKNYILTDPKFVEPETGLKAFPGILHLALRMAGVHDFLRLSIVKTI